WTTRPGRRRPSSCRASGATIRSTCPRLPAPAPSASGWRRTGRLPPEEPAGPGPTGGGPGGLEFGVNLNNRAPLLTEGYGVRDLVDLGVFAEERGFDSLWVGDSLLARPRHDPLMLMAALSQRTSSGRLG